MLAGNIERNRILRIVRDRPDGDIDTLMARIAHIRTWTYVSHRTNWLDDARRWQERTREIEDRLSDVLHERLTQRFVDRRAAALSRVRVKESLFATIETDCSIVVEGEFVGRIEGFRFVADAGEDGGHHALLAAANRVLRGEISHRVSQLEADDDAAFALDPLMGEAWFLAPAPLTSSSSQSEQG